MQVQTPLNIHSQESFPERALSALSSLEGAPFDEPSQASSSRQNALDSSSDVCPLETCMSSTASRHEKPSCEQVEQRDDDEDDNYNDEDECLLRNKYLDSLQLLQKNKVVIDRLTKRLSLIEKETSSIASELDAIETKISPMLSLHVPSYDCSHNNDEDATTATCTSTTLSKTRSPDRDFPQEEEASARRYITLSEEQHSQDECLLNDIETLSAFCCDLSSISKCLSEPPVAQHDKRMRCHSVDASHVEELLSNKNIVESVVFSVGEADDDLSEMSGLSAIPHQDDDNHRLDASILGSFVSTREEQNDQLLFTDFGNACSTVATFEQTGQKSHLYAFPEDLCCLFQEPSQNIAIPASEHDDDEEDAPCFIIGIKSKRNEEDECGCIIC